MNIQEINIGQYPNDGSGDDLRTAFEKIINNFSEIDLNVVISASNIGTGSPIAIETASNNQLLFRSIKSGNANMQVSNTDNEVVLTVLDNNLEDLANVSSAPANLGQSLVWTGSDWRPESIVNKIIPGENITIDSVDGTGEITISSTGGGLPSGIDFGTISSARNSIELILQATPVDFGTVYEQSSIFLDLGGIFEVPLPPVVATYSLLSSSYSILEGDAVTIFLSTTNVPNGTLIPYTISGVLTSDISGQSLTGNFTVVNNSAEITINTSDLSEDKTLTLSLNGILPVISVSITISNTTIPDVVDGGGVSTISFTSIANGGTVSVSIVDDILDGGVIPINGGAPDTTIFSNIFNGGNPSDVSTQTFDGGIVS